MGRVALLATRATELALADSGLVRHRSLSDGSVGIAYGSTAGGMRAMEIYAANLYTRPTLKNIAGTDYLQFMSHTCGAKLAQVFRNTGRVMPTSSACTAGSPDIGHAARGCEMAKQNA